MRREPAPREAQEFPEARLPVGKMQRLRTLALGETAWAGATVNRTGAVGKTALSFWVWIRPGAARDSGALAFSAS